ncbi:cytochrome P450 71A9-like [Dioscorea cayenensis subsp. rotundata]|uniref:Cytochrome P450 71A9-like n=1 Tax=Dioscorea cayennensis subsp. rotundata TaxID=55577 RepID=A0AB40CD08_DIOCR|nr:cytochrome P450 71A9-like [Dioscorea cayenensis subsp. rotundata]
MSHDYLTQPFFLLSSFFVLLLSIKLVLFSNTKSVKLPPSPWKLPFIGNLHQIGLLPHQSLHKLSKKYGPLMLLKLGQVPTLVVSSSQMAKEILKTRDLNFANRPTLRAAEILLYGSLDIGFSPYGEHWRQMRKVCMINFFSMKKVQSFHATREEEVAHLMDKIASQTFSNPSEPLNMSQVLYFFSNDMLCKAMLGKISKKVDRNKIFHEMIEENILLLSGFNLVDYFPSLGWLNSLLGLDKRAKRNFSKWDVVLNQIIREHAIIDEKVKNDGFVDILLSLQKNPPTDFSFSDDHIKALLLDMFAAGTETTYIVLEWSFAELIKNPEIMNKLQNEIRNFTHGKSMVQKEDICEMKYLKAVIKEILRLHPPVPLLLPRESIEACQIEGYEVQRKTRVIINYWAIARDPKVWDSPEEFKPERFISNDIDFKGQNYEFIPFGAGRRICPGMHFAVSTVELALANLIYRFDWKFPRSVDGEEIDMTETPGLTTRMKQNLYLIPNSWM